MGDQLEIQRSIAVHSAKMRAVGEMAGGIAHQVNNPLAVLKLRLENLQIMVKGLSLAPDQRQRLEEQCDGTERIIERIAKITSSLLRMARNANTDQAMSMSVDHIADEALEMCKERFVTNGVDVRVAKDLGDYLIRCNATEVSQAVLNLLSNAYDAVVSTPSPWIELGVEQTPESVTITITDSGTGIPADLQDKIMTPFFTTKEYGKGTGVGLSIATDLIERNGGKLTLDVRHPNTRFCITFPSSLGRPRAHEAASL